MTQNSYLGRENMCQITFDMSRKVAPASPGEKIAHVMFACKSGVSLQDLERGTGLLPDQISEGLKVLTEVGGIEKQTDGSYSLDADPEKVFKLSDWVTTVQNERFDL